MIRPDLLVVDPVDDGDDRDDVDACRPEVLDGAQLDVEQVADQPMSVGGVADAVELQVRVTQPASAAARANSGLFANSMPLVAACTEL